MPPPPPENVTRLPVLAPRRADSHKGTYGRVLVVAGSRGMSGAAVLCASASLRGGAGLVRLAVPEGILPMVAAANPCYTTAPLSQDDSGQLAAGAEPALLELTRGNDVVALGPGLGSSPALTALVSALVAWSETPLVLDADGLNVLVGHADRLRHRPAPLILTPHPGEFARLLGSDIPAVLARSQELAVAFAAEHALVLILKGHRTLVTDGRRVYRNTTGNPGMATGGSGDVLTGLVAALVGQGLDAFAAAQLGVYLHGLAGDLACAERGEVSLIATDLLEYLPQAFQRRPLPSPHPMP
jgi:NAD(P)H-hydrate epimerase